MTYFKRNERFIKTAVLTKPVKDAGGVIKEIEEYSKWHDLDNGGRIQLTLTIVRMSNGSNEAYILSDNLGFVASQPTTDLSDVKDWLVVHGYKTTHDWYTQDCGMTEETWKEWNGSND